MTTRRKFIRLSALGASLLTTPRVFAGKPDVKKPIVLSTWDFGLAANEAAWKILSQGGKALDAVEAGAKVPEADPLVLWMKKAIAARWLALKILYMLFRWPGW
jgi:hypothetical protein